MFSHTRCKKLFLIDEKYKEVYTLLTGGKSFSCIHWGSLFEANSRCHGHQTLGLCKLPRWIQRVRNLYPVCIVIISPFPPFSLYIESSRKGALSWWQHQKLILCNGQAPLPNLWRDQYSLKWQNTKLAPWSDCSIFIIYSVIWVTREGVWAKQHSQCTVVKLKPVYTFP